MRYILSDGVIYAVKQDKFQLILGHLSSGSNIKNNLPSYGARLIGTVDLDITSLTQEQARNELAALKGGFDD